MPIKPVDQLAMDEQVWDDPEMEELLEARAAAREERRPYDQAYQEADDRAKAAIEEAIPVGETVRVGRFRVSREMKPARHVEFDTESKAGISITAGDE